MVLDKAIDAYWIVPEQPGTPVLWLSCSSSWVECRFVASDHLVLVYASRVAALSHIRPRLRTLVVHSSDNTRLFSGHKP